MANQHFGCGGLRSWRVPPVGAHRLSHFHFLKQNQRRTRPPDTQYFPEVCLCPRLYFFTYLPTLGIVRLSHSIAAVCCLHCSRRQSAQSSHRALRWPTPLATGENLAFASVKMSIPSIRGTSFALRGASRTVAVSTAMRSVARRGNSSIALEGQQQVWNYCLPSFCTQLVCLMLINRAAAPFRPPL